MSKENLKKLQSYDRLSIKNDLGGPMVGKCFLFMQVLFVILKFVAIFVL